MSNSVSGSAEEIARKGLALLTLTLLAGSCANVVPPQPPAHVAAPSCSTSAATISFDFAGASQSRCIVKGEREFAIVVVPEHAPPINPSPWYAFRYKAAPGSDLTIHLEYREGLHRYPPKLESANRLTVIEPEVSPDLAMATFQVPNGHGRVSAQEIFSDQRYEELIERMTQQDGIEQEVIGRSLGGRPVKALRMGRPDAPKLIVLLGRAHPPEVSGAVAMEAFLEQLARLYGTGEIDPGGLQVFAVPQLNPDGVEKGYWRANLAGVDLNRDWGRFSQPETRAVADYLRGLEPGIEPVVMLDFHSTRRNLFYVQGSCETDEQQEYFLEDWLGNKIGQIEGYSFSVERRDANPGAGTSKTWFHREYGIPAYTFEVGDETERNAAEAAAREFARTLPPAIFGSRETHKSFNDGANPDC